MKIYKANDHEKVGDRRPGRTTMIRNGLLVAALALAGLAVWYGNAVYRELSKKPVYATLQRLEIRYRDQIIPASARIVTSDGLRAVVLRSGDPTSPYIWVATNAYNGTIKDDVFRLGEVQLPETPCRTLTPVLNDPTTIPSARAYLRRNCRP